MISALLFSSSFLNFAFYIYAIGFVIALVLEQFVKKTDNERNIFIVETNRKYEINCDKDIGCTFDYIREIKWYFDIIE